MSCSLRAAAASSLMGGGAGRACAVSPASDMTNTRVPGKCAVVAAELRTGRVEADASHDERCKRVVVGGVLFTALERAMTEPSAWQAKSMGQTLE
jgi:hypothetical protein